MEDWDDEMVICGGVITGNGWIDQGDRKMTEGWDEG